MHSWNLYVPPYDFRRSGLDEMDAIAGEIITDRLKVQLLLVSFMELSTGMAWVCYTSCYCLLLLTDISSGRLDHNAWVAFILCDYDRDHERPCGPVCSTHSHFSYFSTFRCVLTSYPFDRALIILSPALCGLLSESVILPKGRGVCWSPRLSLPPLRPR